MMMDAYQVPFSIDLHDFRESQLANIRIILKPWTRSVIDAANAYVHSLRKHCWCSWGCFPRNRMMVVVRLMIQRFQTHRDQTQTPVLRTDEPRMGMRQFHIQTLYFNGYQLQTVSFFRCFLQHLTRSSLLACRFMAWLFRNSRNVRHTCGKMIQHSVPIDEISHHHLHFPHHQPDWAIMRMAQVTLDLQSGHRFHLKRQHGNSINPVPVWEFRVLQQGSTAQGSFGLALFTTVSQLCREPQMFTVATAVTEHTMLVSKFFPQKDAALLCVVSLNESKKVHNKKQLECGCNIGYSVLKSQRSGTLRHNLTAKYTCINV